MLTLDFGDRIPYKTYKGFQAEMGTFVIGIRNVFWVATKNGHFVTDAEAVDDEIFSAELASLPIGAALANIGGIDGGAWIVFTFDNGFALKVDTTNAWKSEMDVFEVRMPNGQHVFLNDQGQLELGQN